MPYYFNSLREQHFKHVNMQNGKIWALTKKNELIAKAEVNKLDYQPSPIDDLMLKRKNIKKMYVSRQGSHCILLAEHELFYNNWADNTIIQLDRVLLDSMVEGRSASMAGTSRPRAFRSVDVYQAPDDDTLFEILLGTQDGQIFHAALLYCDGQLEVIEPFESVLELTDSKAILDIKMARVSFDQHVILAVTESSLYQLSGDYTFRNLLLEYRNDKAMLQKSQLTLEATVRGLDQQRSISAQEDDAYVQQSISLQLFYDQREKVKDSKPLGFGWMHELKFCFAEFQY